MMTARFDVAVHARESRPARPSCSRGDRRQVPASPLRRAAGEQTRPSWTTGSAGSWNLSAASMFPGLSRTDGRSAPTGARCSLVDELRWYALVPSLHAATGRRRRPGVVVSSPTGRSVDDVPWSVEDLVVRSASALLVGPPFLFAVAVLIGPVDVFDPRARRGSRRHGATAAGGDVAFAARPAAMSVRGMTSRARAIPTARSARPAGPRERRVVLGLRPHASHRSDSRQPSGHVRAPWPCSAFAGRIGVSRAARP